MISLSNLSVDSRLSNISLNLKRGEILGIIGPNGAGKSTLLKSVVGVENYTGEIKILGEIFSSYKPKQRARLVGYLPQTIESAWSLKVEDVVALGRTPWGDEHREKIEAAMALTDVARFANRNISELSGGERARVWLARVFAGEPQVIVADEPISSLDIHYQIEVMEMLKQFSESGHSVMVAIHDLSLAARYCQRIILLERGEIIAVGPTKQTLTGETLSKLFQISVHCDLESNPPIILPK